MCAVPYGIMANILHNTSTSTSYSKSNGINVPFHSIHMIAYRCGMLHEPKKNRLSRTGNFMRQPMARQQQQQLRATEKPESPGTTKSHSARGKSMEMAVNGAWNCCINRTGKKCHKMDIERKRLWIPYFQIADGKKDRRKWWAELWRKSLCISRNAIDVQTATDSLDWMATATTAIYSWHFVWWQFSHARSGKSGIFNHK